MTRENMKVRELLTARMYERTGDIDVYDDYDERCGCAWCGTLLTEEGKKEFARALDLNCMILWQHEGYINTVVVECPKAKDASEIARLIESMAGYCGADDWDRWFRD